MYRQSLVINLTALSNSLVKDSFLGFQKLVFPLYFGAYEFEWANMWKEWAEGIDVVGISTAARQHEDLVEFRLPGFGPRMYTSTDSELGSFSDSLDPMRLDVSR
jgi:hypothetical protein